MTKDQVIIWTIVGIMAINVIMIAAIIWSINHVKALRSDWDSVMKDDADNAHGDVPHVPDRRFETLS